MIFRKMKLHNFRQFKGDTEIHFSTDNDKNVTVITGNNGAGKTTLLQAFNWCLYGQLKLENPDDLITKEVISKVGIGEKERVEVSIEFEHLKKIYTCRNYIDYIRNSNGNIQKLDEDRLFSISDPVTGETKRTNQNAIREIFPSDLSTYFLFDGERMQDLVDNQRSGKKDLSNAVKNLLGLDVLENAKYHLEKAKKEFETEFVSDSSSRLTEINEELKLIDQKIDEETANKEKYENELIDLEKKQSKVNDILKSYAGLKELQNKRVELAREMERTEIDIEKKKKDIFRTFGTASVNYFLGSTFDILKDKIQKSDLSDKAIEGINANAINHILKNGQCICGCELDKNPQAIKKLEELRSYLPPESYSILLKGLEVHISNAEENNGKYYQNFNQMYEEYNNLINKKDILTNKINDNEKLIADAGDQDLSKYNEEYISLGSQIASKNQAIGSCKNQIEVLKQTQRNREDERSRITVSSNINDGVQFKVDICEKLIGDMTNRLNKKEKEVKEELQEKTSELLSKMLNSEKSIYIEDDYNFNVADEYKTTTLSEGEKIVTSFAFVGSIISIAKEVISREKDEELGLEDDDRFTLVMDAPFAKLDLSHRKNVTSLIPTLTDQIILFSADSQWDGVVEDALKNKIGLMYNIDKNGTTSSIRLIEKEVQ